MQNYNREAQLAKLLGWDHATIVGTDKAVVLALLKARCRQMRKLGREMPWHYSLPIHQALVDAIRHENGR